MRNFIVKHMRMIQSGFAASVLCISAGCIPGAPAWVGDFLSAAAENPSAFESITIIGTETNGVYLIRNDLPDDLFRNAGPLFWPISSFAPEGDPPPLKHDVGVVDLGSGAFQMLIDDEVQTPFAIANQRWIVWSNDQGSIVFARDLSDQSTRQFTANSGDGDSAYLQFLALANDHVWIQRYVYDNNDLSSGHSLVELDLTSGMWTDHGAIFTDSVYQALFHNGALLAFEVIHEEFQRGPQPVSIPDFSVDFSAPRSRYRLVSFDTTTHQKNTVLETTEATGAYPSELIAGENGAVLWREDDYSTNHTAFRSILPGETQISTLATVTIEAPSFDSDGANPFMPSGKSTAVIAWGPRGYLVEQSEFMGGSWFAPNTKRTYNFHGFDGVSFEIASFGTQGLALSPVTAVVGDFVALRDQQSGELIVTNIDSRETRRTPLFP